VLVVTGATGSIGRYVLQHLGKRRAELKALVRTEGRGKELGVPYVVADFNDPQTLAPAFAGAERLFLNGPVDEAMVRQQKNAVDAAVAAGVRRLVRVSAAGSSMTSDRAINRWHGEVDDYIEKCGRSFALLRPTFFTQNLLNSGQSVRAEGRFYGAFGQGRLAFIDCSDIAECAAVLLTRAMNRSGAFILTGGETLSFADVAAKLHAKLGRSVAYVDRSVAEVVAAMKGRGMPASIAESFGKMMQSFSAGGASAITSTVKELTGHEPRTVDDFLDEHLDRFR
jgi:uncharacterized protein YbjT (DUF2867 family)